MTICAAINRAIRPGITQIAGADVYARASAMETAVAMGHTRICIRPRDTHVAVVVLRKVASVAHTLVSRVEIDAGGVG